MSAGGARVVALLRGTGQTLAAAESLTGGLVAAALTEAPGASPVVLGAVVAYDPGVKVGVLGVPRSLLDSHGVVSRECSEAMASGVRALLGVDWAVATTGVAGPGPSDGHPAGTVHVAVAGEHVRAHRALHLNGDRTQVRDGTVEAALQLLHDTLQRTLSGPAGTVEISSWDGTDDAEEGDHGAATTRAR